MYIQYLHCIMYINIIIYIILLHCISKYTVNHIFEDSDVVTNESFYLIV